MSSFRSFLSRLRALGRPVQPPAPVSSVDRMPADPAPPADDTSGANDTAAPALPEPPPAPAAPPAPPPRLPPWSPLPVFHTPARGRKRITLLLDTAPGGGPLESASAPLILALLLAQRCAADLRLVTRLAPAQPASLQPVLQAVGGFDAGELQLRFLPASHDKAELDLVEGEWLITDAWWNAVAALTAVEPARVVCLLQADERLSPIDNEARRRCEDLLCRRDLVWLVGGAALQQHLVRSELDHFAAPALCFEPATDGAPVWPDTFAPVLDALARRI